MFFATSPFSNVHAEDALQLNNMDEKIEINHRNRLQYP